MSLEILLLYLEREKIAREVGEYYLESNGFKVKAYSNLKYALKFTDIKDYDMIIAHLKSDEYKPLFECAKEHGIFVAIAPSDAKRYINNDYFLQITKNHDVLLFEGKWYKNLKPENLLPFIRKEPKDLYTTNQ